MYTDQQMFLTGSWTDKSAFDVGHVTEIRTGKKVPSHRGEIVLKVLEPQLHEQLGSNPYTEEVRFFRIIHLDFYHMFTRKH